MRLILKYFSIILFLFSTCQNNGIRNTITIDVEPNINNFEEVLLSDFATALSYIPLERPGNLTFYGIRKFASYDNLILVSDLKICLLYDNNGNFLTKIGNQGRGPGEYINISNMSISSEKEIYIQCLYDLLIYNVKGEYLRKYENFFLYQDNYIYSWNFVYDSLIFGHIPNSTGQKKYKAIVLNKEGKIFKLYNNSLLFNRTKELFSGQEGHANIISSEGKFFYKEIYNDTLFIINPSFQLKPCLIFDFGRFTEPMSHREAKTLLPDLGYNEEWSNYIYLENIFINRDYLFLDCQYKGHFPAKRLTPRIVAGIKSDYNTTNVLGIFTRESSELVFCKPTDSNNPLFSSGIYNDIDAGPRFYPLKQINDLTLVMWIESAQLKEHVASDDFKEIVPKYPEKKKELEILSNSLSEFDGPVLMYMTLKIRE